MLPTLSKTALLRSFPAISALLAALASVPAIAQTQDIVVGQVAPLSGVLADTGREMVLGGQIYSDHINAKGRIKGRRIKHVVKDDGYRIALA